jgi:hypothetical protein
MGPVVFMEVVFSLSVSSLNIRNIDMATASYLFDLLEELLLIFIIERRVTRQQHVANHAHAPDVNLCAVWVASENLRGHVARSAASNLLQFQLGDLLSKPKVCYLNIPIVVLCTNNMF